MGPEVTPRCAESPDPGPDDAHAGPRRAPTAIVVGHRRRQALGPRPPSSTAPRSPSGRGITGLLGANGAGKTTLLGMMLGLHRPDRGRARRCSASTRSAPAPRCASGSATRPSTTPCRPTPRAHDLVRHIAEVHGLPSPRGDRPGQRRALAGRVSARSASGPIGTMSTGQRQRVKLAQAIAHDPHLVLLDEPTDGLDPVQRDDMLALIRRIGTEFGIDIILSSHLLEEVERVCDCAVILAGGPGRGRTARSPSSPASTAALLVEVDDQRRTSWPHALRERGADGRGRRRPA